MEKINDGGPAFPFEDVLDKVGTPGPSTGMSLRDYFAGRALPGAISDASSIFDDDDDGSVNRFDWCASRAYLYADAMLAARGPQGRDSAAGGAK